MNKLHKLKLISNKIYRLSEDKNKYHKEIAKTHKILDDLAGDIPPEKFKKLYGDLNARKNFVERFYQSKSGDPEKHKEWMNKHRELMKQHKFDEIPPNVAQETEQPKNLPDWLSESVDRHHKLAEHAGVVDKIKSLAGQMKTRQEIVLEIAPLLEKAGIPKEDHAAVVLATRNKLGIPSMDDKEEFKKWQSKEFNKPNKKTDVKENKKTGISNPNLIRNTSISNPNVVRNTAVQNKNMVRNTDVQPSNAKSPKENKPMTPAGAPKENTSVQVIPDVFKQNSTNIQTKPNAPKNPNTNIKNTGLGNQGGSVTPQVSPSAQSTNNSSMTPQNNAEKPVMMEEVKPEEENTFNIDTVANEAKLGGDRAELHADEIDPQATKMFEQDLTKHRENLNKVHEANKTQDSQVFKMNPLAKFRANMAMHAARMYLMGARKGLSNVQSQILYRIAADDTHPYHDRVHKLMDRIKETYLNFNKPRSEEDRIQEIMYRNELKKKAAERAKLAEKHINKTQEEENKIRKMMEARRLRKIVAQRLKQPDIKK